MFSLALLFVLFALLGAGAIAEEHYAAMNNLLGLLLGHSLVTAISYLAFHFAPAAVIKFTAINSCVAAWSLEEIKNPGEVKTLFSFAKRSVYFHQKTALSETLKIIPVCDRYIALEDKIRFCLNPISLLMASLFFVENVFIYLVNSIPQKPSGDKPVSDVSYNASHAIYRVAKGVVSATCTLLIIPLKFIEPIGGFFYQSLYLITIIIPDYFASLAQVKPAHLKLQDAPRQGLSKHLLHRYSTNDINKKLSEKILEA